MTSLHCSDLRLDEQKVLPKACMMHNLSGSAEPFLFSHSLLGIVLHEDVSGMCQITMQQLDSWLHLSSLLAVHTAYDKGVVLRDAKAMHQACILEQCRHSNQTPLP